VGEIQVHMREPARHQRHPLCRVRSDPVLRAEHSRLNCRLPVLWLLEYLLLLRHEKVLDREPLRNHAKTPNSLYIYIRIITHTDVFFFVQKKSFILSLQTNLV
jgi:hypothetical protein